jgi:hypothetical protein
MNGLDGGCLVSAIYQAFEPAARRRGFGSAAARRK